MAAVQCPFPGCAYEAANDDAQIVVALLNIHAQSHAQATARPTALQPKLDRPRIDMGVEEEMWNSFVRRWEAFRIGSNIDAATAPMQLFQCASEALGDLVLKAHPGIQSETVDMVMQTMRDLAVIPVAIGVRRAELMDLRQTPDEPFRTFAAKTKGKAETCSFRTSVKCECNRTVEVDYTTETVRDVLLAGIADLDIRREALSMQNIQKKTLNEVISFVESREMARNATPCSMSALSTFKRKQTPPATKNAHPENANKAHPEANKTAPCLECGVTFSVYKQRANGTWNSKPHKKCINCWRAERRKSQGVSANLVEPIVTQIGAINSVPCPTSIISKNSLNRHRGSNHPRVELKISQRTKAQPEAVIRAVADSGAMANLWGIQQYL